MRAKIKPMRGDSVVAQTDIAGLPTEFGATPVLLDVREDDEWQQRNGFRPVNVNGGMPRWANAGRPVITDGSGPGSV